MTYRPIIAFLVASVSFAAAATATEVSLGINGSCAFPQGRMVTGGDVYYYNDPTWAGLLGLSTGPGGAIRALIAPWRLGEIEIGAAFEKFPGIPRPGEGTIVPLRAGFNLKADRGRYALRCGGGGGYYVFKAHAYGSVLYNDPGLGPRWEGSWGDVNLSAPALYYGFGVSLNFGKWSLDFTPRWNYIFNEGSYTGTAVDDYEGYELYFDLPYNCTYAEAMLGVSYRVF